MNVVASNGSVISPKAQGHYFKAQFQEGSELSPQKLPPLQANLFYPTRRYHQNGRSVNFSQSKQSNPSFQQGSSTMTTSPIQNKHAASHKVSTQKIRDIAMINEFKKTNNPFEQGYTRSDKVRYAGTSTQEPHRRLFEFGTISSLNQSQAFPGASMSSGSKKVKGVQDLRATFHSNRLMQQIVDEEQFIRTNPKLVTNIESLWKMNLLNDKNIHAMQLPKNHSISYVYNDYHSRSTNPGYARNDKSGTFFTR